MTQAKATATAKAIAKAKAKEKRVILLQSPNQLSETPFSLYRLRNAINKAFYDKGVTDLVVAIVSKTLTYNIIVSTTDLFTSDFLIKKQAI